MKTAVDALTNLSLDPEAQRIARERDGNERSAILDAATLDDLFRK